MRRHVMRVFRFLQRPSEERRLLAMVTVLLALARLGMAYADLPRTRRLVAWLAPRRTLAPLRLAELVRAASPALPGVTPCGPRAIVLEALLIQAGHAAELRIGVAPLAGRERPDAHAWVEVGGVAVAEDPSRYTALPLFGARG
jgi:transglutaminase superfamily protein